MTEVITEVITKENAYNAAFLTWINDLKKNCNTVIDGVTLDIPLMTYIAPAFDGLMTGPVSTENGVEIHAKSFRFDSWEELVEWARNAGRNGQKTYLYQIMFSPSTFSFMEMDSDTFEPKAINPPKMTKQQWLLRCAVV